METTFYKATHKETKKWLVGKTEQQMVNEIWDLIKGPGGSEFLDLLKDNPYSIKWEEITEVEFASCTKRTLTDPLSFSYKNKKRSGGKVPVMLIAEGQIENFDSVSDLMKRLKGVVSRYKVKKMLEDPSLTVEGFSVKKL